MRLKAGARSDGGRLGSLPLPEDERAGERGSVSVEAAIIVPAILLIVFLILEAGLYMHTRNVAARAAAAAAVSAAAWHATDSDGQAAGQAVLDQTLSEGEASNIQITRTATQVVATVQADSTSIVGVLTDTTVTQSAAAPIERWTQ